MPRETCCGWTLHPSSAQRLLTHTSFCALCQERHISSPRAALSICLRFRLIPWKLFPTHCHCRAPLCITAAEGASHPEPTNSYCGAQDLSNREGSTGETSWSLVGSFCHSTWPILQVGPATDPCLMYIYTAGCYSLDWGEEKHCRHPLATVSERRKPSLVFPCMYLLWNQIVIGN